MVVWLLNMRLKLCSKISESEIDYEFDRACPRIIWNDFLQKVLNVLPAIKFYDQDVSHLNSSVKCKWLTLYTIPVVHKAFVKWGNLCCHFGFTSFTVSLLSVIHAFELLQELTRAYASDKISLITKKIKSSFIWRCVGWSQATVMTCQPQP